MECLRKKMPAESVEVARLAQVPVDTPAACHGPAVAQALAVKCEITPGPIRPERATAPSWIVKDGFMSHVDRDDF
jgi:hypothetical protein